MSKGNIKCKIGEHETFSMSSYSGVAPYLEDGGDRGMWLQQEKLPPFLPANFHISITIHPDSGEKEERGGRGGEGEEEEERGGGGGGERGRSTLNIECLFPVSSIAIAMQKANGSGVTTF